MIQLHTLKCNILHIKCTRTQYTHDTRALEQIVFFSFVFVLGINCLMKSTRWRFELTNFFLSPRTEESECFSIDLLWKLSEYFFLRMNLFH